ncbi:GAF domain-containing protein [Candidatus Falkowbacteria bacterium]|nr:GAF domain-containing protein [Candidatus Falkowbacteria bacterium]
MNFFALTALWNSIALLGLAAWIITKGFSKPAYRNIAYTVLCVALWSFGYFLWQTAPNIYMAEAYLRLMMFWVMFIPLFFIRYILFLVGQMHQRRLGLASTYFFSVLFSLATLDGLLSNGVNAGTGYLRYYPIPGPLFVPFIIYFMAYLVYAIAIMIKASENASPIDRLKNRYVLIGVAVAYTFNITNYISWYTHDFPPIGNLFMAASFFVVVYGIIARHIFDIRLIARRSTIRIVWFTCVLAIALYIKMAISELFGNTPWADIIMLLSAFALYSPFKKYAEKIASTYLFTSLYNRSQLLSALSDRLAANLDARAISKEVEELLAPAFYHDGMIVLVFDSNSNLSVVYNRQLNPSSEAPIRPDSSLNKILKSSKPFLLDEMLSDTSKKHPALRTIKSMGAEIIIPLNLKSKLVGLIALGPKKSREVYDDDDLSLLRTVGEQVAFALENSRLHQEVAQFNQTLQQRVNEQTKDIVAKAEHLKKLMEMRGEFLDIASHQLRTPVSVMKGVLSMLEEGSVPAAKRKSFISGAMEKAVKLGDVINDILRASEIDSDHFTFDLMPVQLNAIINKIRPDKERAAELKKIKLIFDLPAKPFPPVLGDERYLEHALVDMINNGIQYTQQGQVTVSARQENGCIIIRVIDTGIGIPAEDLPKLFKKFSRAKNAVEAHADGTGLGLFIIKKVVDFIPGASILVEKTGINEGTTVALKLPLAKK